MSRTWLILGLILLVTAVSPHPLLAHAELIDALPSPGSSVRTLQEIKLVFSEPITNNSHIELQQDFVSVAALEPTVDATDSTVLRTAVPPLPDGVYTVQWSVSSGDGHLVSGSYSLGISRTAPAQTPWYLRSWAFAGLLVGSVGATIIILRHWRSTAGSEKVQLTKRASQGKRVSRKPGS